MATRAPETPHFLQVLDSEQIFWNFPILSDRGFWAQGHAQSSRCHHSPRNFVQIAKMARRAPETPHFWPFSRAPVNILAQRFSRGRRKRRQPIIRFRHFAKKQRKHLSTSL